MKDTPQPAKRRRDYAAFRVEALRLASESRSTQAAVRALTIDPTQTYKWQKEALNPVAAARGAELDPPWRPSCATCGPLIGGRHRNWRFRSCLGSQLTS